MATMCSQQRRLLLLVDGNALVHRAFHALPPLTTSRSGEMVNAVFGFANTLFRVVGSIKATHWAIAFDYPAPTFRHALFDHYKAQRPPTPEELKTQLGRVRELAAALGIPSFELKGYEADDLLGALAQHASEAGTEAAILSGDRDLLQLVRPGITVLLPGRTFSDAVTYDEGAVEARFGVKPGQLTAYKALVGDPSDNIPGVPGVGDKTAARLLTKYESLDALYEHIAEITPPKLQASLAASREQAMTSLKLAAIVTDVPVQFKLDDCRIGEYDRERALALLKELEFNSLVARLPTPLSQVAPPATPPTAQPGPDARVLVASAHAAALKDELRQAAEVVLCVAPGDAAHEAAKGAKRPGRTYAAPRGIAVSAGSERVYYQPVAPEATSSAGQLGLEQPLSLLAPALERESCLKVCDDAKALLRHLAALGVAAVGPWFDTSVAAHLVGEKNVALEAIASSRLGVTLAAKPSGGDELNPATDNDVASWLAARVSACRSLRESLEADMGERKVLDLFHGVEMPLVPVLASMEDHGILVDTQKLKEMSRTLSDQLASLEIDIYKAVGHRFNINSPQQLGNVLFTELGLPGGRKTSNGYSTEASLLETLRPANPVIDLVLQYRQLAKLKSTYVDTFPGLVNPQTGRIHTVFSQTGTATGRLSSSDPNLQNLPIRTELGRTIRAAVIAPRGWSLLSADYSQIDLRCLAHLSGDEALVSAFRHGEDIHTTTAGRVFGVAPENVTPEMRRAAKVVNFGVVYGMSDYGLEQATGFTRAEAGKFIKTYFEQYPGVRRWIEQTKAQARETLFVTTLLGRRRYVPEIRSTNRQVREGAERMAINAPVQGTSADIIKVAMIRIYDAMRREKLESKMLLQIHDELLFEIPDSEFKRMVGLVRELMPGAVQLNVPLKVDLKSGPNWADMEPVASSL
ncbi:MAG: DNA polymerase I [Dehalococcoidia bacterium]|jgi:DNA polymerase-1|nr:DNA polymerase I [Dehalococcoidia bacterium]